MKLFSRPGGHFYKDNRTGLFPSVTTILHSIPNPQLEAWKARTQNWRKISSTACHIGTSVHKDIADALNHKQKPIKYKIPFQAFLNWNAEYHLMSIKTELKIKSKKGYAGSLDILGIANNALHIIDIKTSSQIYDNFLLQLAAYKNALQEMGERRHIDIAILRVDKYSEEYEWKVYTDNEYREGIAEFLSLCTEWHETHDTKREFQKRFVLED